MVEVTAERYTRREVLALEKRLRETSTVLALCDVHQVPAKHVEHAIAAQSSVW